MAGTLEKLRAGFRPDRRALFSLGAMLFVFGNMAWGKISPGNLRCEYMENPAAAGFLFEHLQRICYTD